MAKQEKRYRLKALNITLRGRVLRQSDKKELKESDFPKNVLKEYLASGHIEEIDDTKGEDTKSEDTKSEESKAPTAPGKSKKGKK